MNSAPTICDVARHAGVSIKTVSRVINREANVSPTTRARVDAAIHALGYRPNLSARSLAGGRSYLIGLIYDNPSPGYISELQRGALQVCSGNGRHLMVMQVDCQAADAVATVRGAVRSIRMDGLILSPPVCDHEGILDALDALRVPYVRIAPDQQRQRSASVCLNDHAAAAEMTRMLLDAGHRHVGFIRTRTDHAAAGYRYTGWLEALGAAGIPENPNWVGEGDNTVASGMRLTKQFLAAPQRPTAIFAGNDDMAVGALMAAYAHGLHVPSDVSIVGFDDTPLASSVNPMLTTIRQPVAHMAMLAARQLVERTTPTQTPVTQWVDYQLIFRASSGAAPPSSALISAA